MDRSSSLTQAGPTRQGRGRWRTYDATDGFSCGGSVRAILQDRDGALWIGSFAGGVSRFDGHRFTQFTPKDGLVSNKVNAMLFDRDGALWVGTTFGVSRYDGSTWTTFTTEHGLAHNMVSSMLEDQDGVLWCGTWEGGLSRFDGKAWTTFTTADGLAGNNVQSMFQDRDGTYWFGTWEGGLSRFDGKTWTTFTAADGLAGNEVWAICQDRDGVLWLATGNWGTEAGGLTRYDGKHWSVSTTEHGLPSNRVWSLLPAQDGSLWVGTKTWGTTEGGVSRYDGQHWTTFTATDGLADTSVEAMFQDREGSLWFGTRGGLSQYEAVAWTTFTTEDGLQSNHIHSLFQDREYTLWVGTAGGVSRCDGQTCTPTASLDSVAARGIYSILQDREGTLWGHTADGVRCYDGQTWIPVALPDGLAAQPIRGLRTDQEGGIWVWTATHLSRRDGQTWTSFALEGLSLGEGIVGILQARDGALWVAAPGAGVNRFAGQRWTTFTTRDGLASNYALTLFEDQQGAIWVGTQQGLNRYQGGQWQTFTTADGLADDWVEVVFQSCEGTIWVGTSGGVSRYDGEQWQTFAAPQPAGNAVGTIIQSQDGRIWFGTRGGGVNCFDGQVVQTLTAADGLAGNQVSAVLQDRGGDLWFGTASGLTRYRPPSPSPPPIFIDAVVADRRYEGRTEIEVPVGARLIAGEFHGISFKTRPEAMVYRYRLIGHDDTWQNTHARRVEYRDLPLGAYRFQVQAVDRDLAYSEVAEVQLTVIPDPRVAALTEVLRAGGTPGDFVGKSPYLQLLLAQVQEVARTELTALVQGETGTGKGLVARAIHTWSGRKNGPFIQVNCGALPEGLVESELFGHERGAFTGASTRKLGRVELAEGGTLFLDEIGDLSPAAQVKILRVLEERVFERVGGQKTLRADMRVVAATNRNLEQMVAAGTFREDLYYRLRVYPIEVPSLRERQEDIPLLAAYFLARMASHLNKKVQPLTWEVEQALQAYAWPGNVRELEHVIQRAVIVCKGDRIRVEDLEVGSRGTGAVEDFVSLEEHERRYIQEVLARTGGRIRGAEGAAAVLGLHEATLRSRMKKLGISREGA